MAGGVHELHLWAAYIGVDHCCKTYSSKLLFQMDFTIIAKSKLFQLSVKLHPRKKWGSIKWLCKLENRAARSFLLYCRSCQNNEKFKSTLKIEWFQMRIVSILQQKIWILGRQISCFVFCFVHCYQRSGGLLLWERSALLLWGSCGGNLKSYLLVLTRWWTGDGGGDGVQWWL